MRQFAVPCYRLLWSLAFFRACTNDAQFEMNVSLLSSVVTGLSAWAIDERRIDARPLVAGFNWA